ncbi:MBL fold metallo-hydrolase [Streptomyces sp. M10(2022)]
MALGLGTGAASATAVGPGPQAAPAGRKRRDRDPGAPVTLRWLGVAGWELAFDGHRILVDPYLSRQEYRVPGSGAIDADRALAPDGGIVEAVVGRHLADVPELILVTHGHFDHLLDVPHLLNRPQWRDSAIRTLCGETSLHLLNGLGTEQKRLNEAIVLSGGEVLRSRPARPPRLPRTPSRCSAASTASTETTASSPRHADPSAGGRPHPGDMREGGTLAYQVTVGVGRVSCSSAAPPTSPRGTPGCPA